MSDSAIDSLASPTSGFPKDMPHLQQQLKALFALWESQRFSNAPSQLPELIKQSLVLNAILQKQPCITCIMEVRTSQYLYMSNQAEAITGYPVADFMQAGSAFMYPLVHPDDIGYVMNISQISWQFRLALRAAQRMNYRASYDYRLKKKDGTYVRLLQQSTPLEVDEKGNITYMLIVCSDITHFKKSTGIVFTFSSLDGKTCSVYDFDEHMLKAAELPSEREQDVLRLMAKGYSSKLIADQLNLSYHTIITHRHNMLTKTYCKNSGELIQFALSSGVI